MKWIIIFGILGFFCFYIYLGETPQTKIFRACMPLNTSAGFISKLASNWSQHAATKIISAGDVSTRWCQYGIYRTFYGAAKH